MKARCLCAIMAGLLGGMPLARALDAPLDPAFLVVTGAGSPGSTGIYAQAGVYNGSAQYARQSDSAFVLWRRSTNLWSSQWVLSDVAPTGAWASSPNWMFTCHLLPQGTSAVGSAGASGTVSVSVYDPSNPTGMPVLLPVPVPVPPPAYPSRIEITGTLAPDATGVYEKAAAPYNGLPAWTRQGDGAFSIWAINGAIWRLSTAPGSTAAGCWKWDYRTPGRSDSTGSDTYTGVASSECADPDFPTPARYLAGRPHPVFRPGHTLPPLTKFSWTYSYELTREMARWGYALDFGDATPQSVSNLANASTREAKIMALMTNEPAGYTLCVNMGRVFLDNPPEAAFCHDTNGVLVTPKTFSPQAPDAVLSAIASQTVECLRQVVSRAPAAVILNGGERGMGVYGNNGNEWRKDPAVLAARGDTPWSDYQSARKRHEEAFFGAGARAVSDALYIYYTCGGNAHRNLVFYDNWWLWDWDYRIFHSASDLPSNESYYKAGNSGWVPPASGLATQGDDALTVALNAVGLAIAMGKPLSYNWLCAGWASNRLSSANSDIGLYCGFLKACYTAGMIGGNAGYYSYPEGGFDAMFDQRAPPHWLEQVEALAWIHAEFSYLEDMLRRGDLLPGPKLHRWSPEQPAYELWTGFYGTRVLARKLKGRQRWLLCAWAADAIPRTVSVDVPILGTVELRAEPAGSLYDARVAGGVRKVTRLDAGSITPSPPVLPAEAPDPDAAPPSAVVSIR